jgi:hypothetical protein
MINQLQFFTNIPFLLEDIETCTRSSWVVIILNLLIAILDNTYSRIAQHDKVKK